MKTMKICRIASAAVLGALLVGGAGCATYPEIAGMEIRSPARPSATVNVQVSETKAARALRVRLGVDGVGEETAPEPLARALQSRVEGALAAKGFAVASEGQASELAVQVAVRAERLNQRGSRVVWKGDADASVRRDPACNPSGAGTLARTWRDVRGNEARGDYEAQKGLAERLAPEVADFAAESVAKAAGSLQVAEVEVRNGWANPDEAAAYATKFTKIVKGLPGVYRCEVAETKREERTLRAEVVFDGQFLPEGIGNRLATQKSLGLGPRRAEDGMRMAHVSIRNGWKKAEAADAAAYASQFVEVVSRMPGVLGCRILETRVAEKILVAEVVFDESLMPEGFENRLVLQDGLGFKRR